MREIIFRAWIKKEKKMLHEDFKIGFTPYSGWSICAYCGLTIGTRIESEYILMQYTGHKDEEGTRIFEGDKVSGLVFNEKIPEIFKVAWNDNLGGFTIGGYPLNVQGLHTLKVIGNIHETEGS